MNFIKQKGNDLIKSRPTAINLEWAVNRMINKLINVEISNIFEVAIQEAQEIIKEDVGFCKNIGMHGFKIIEAIYKTKKDTVNILTHCNAGWLATIDWGLPPLQFITPIKQVSLYM